jgi:hypothetical protein
MSEHSGAAEREVPDEELIAEIKRLSAGVVDGSVPVFFDAQAAKDYRFGRFGG